MSRRPSNFRSASDLDDYLRQHDIPGLADIDTRRLVRMIRTAGAMKGVISSTDLNDSSLVDKARRSHGLIGRDLVREVVPAQAVDWTEELSPWTFLTGSRHKGVSTDPPRIVALDFGMKWNIARHLLGVGARVTVVPGTVAADEVLQRQPNGVLLSNGPGDPEPLEYAIETTRRLLPHVPIFGICLGHQIVALACGARTFKLKFGHRGANQPVLNLLTERVEITSQNHGFAVSEDELPANWRSRTGISTTARLPVFVTVNGQPSACSIIPRPRPVPMTATTCSSSLLRISFRPRSLKTTSC